MDLPSAAHVRPVASAIELSNCLERGLRESRAIDAEALCIVSEEKVRIPRLPSLTARFGRFDSIFALSMIAATSMIVARLQSLLHCTTRAVLIFPSMMAM